MAGTGPGALSVAVVVAASVDAMRGSLSVCQAGSEVQDSTHTWMI